MTYLFYGGLYFTIGSWLRTLYFESIRENIKRKLFWGAGLICIINMGTYWLHGGSIWDNNLHSVIIALCGCYTVWYVLVWWDKRNLLGNHFLQVCGEKSLEIYLLHLYFVGPLRTIFYKLGIDNLLFLVSFATIFAVIGPLCIGFICERNHYLKYVFHPADIVRKFL